MSSRSDLLLHVMAHVRDLLPDKAPRPRSFHILLLRTTVTRPERDEPTSVAAHLCTDELSSPSAVHRLHLSYNCMALRSVCERGDEDEEKWKE
ncbi:hypothetical protein MPTK1_2g10640 [Marchantia polymorpha subsp. ruderalis]|uniref:Uncharacterized protein n=1 Tax=Marchantia polymorpha TaxID=3197 RepID=A0A2R6XC61_MARPO|nr:hypothetical protein MARPO_0023s0032 [Marchantia polymorpha]BBN01837.1 hypothetical protein Mp_2g10640 [Marchantia polymorpha subsp. ruderalis]|eukprot:PTQ43700.1 hypothetical protein MARPO_0023s0032 [Marchantia polymorpha]